MTVQLPGFLTVDALADRYGMAKKTLQNKITQGWGPTPVLDPVTDQVMGFRADAIDRFERRNQCTKKERLYG